MKKLLLSAPSKLSRFYFRILCVIFLFGISATSSAQCSLYQHYNSGTLPTGYTTSGFVVNSALTPATSGNAPRTGITVLTTATSAQYVETPSVATPDVFSFWMRRGTGSNTGTAYIDLQVNDGTNGWQSLRTTTNLTNYGSVGGSGISYSANMDTPLSALGTTYQQFWVKFDGAAQSGYSNSNLKFRIVNAKTTFTGTMYLDDISWSSRTTSENDTFIPDLYTSSCSSSLAAGSSYTLYDVGGEFDNYQLTQDNTLVFTPATAGDKIEITFVSYTSEATNDYISVQDGATQMLTPNNFSGASNPAPLTYTGTASTSMTIKFLSDAVGTTTAAGFKITVKCIAGSTCSLPGTLNAVTSITSSSASATWVAAAGPPAGYDIYVDTNSGATPSGATYTSVTNSRSLTGLTDNTTYYYWVRSNCGGTQSAWVGPSAAFTTICTYIFPPYTENFNGQATPAIPSCTSADNANWQVNTVNGYLTDNVISTNFFTRAVRLTGGQEYRLSYDYGSALGDLDMKVYYGFTNSAPTSSNITTVLNTHLNVTGLNNVIFNFTPPFTATYYIRFELTRVSASPSTLLILDNINLIPETCGPGRTLVASSVTASAATVSWSVPAAPYSPPASGYQYFLSTSSTTPLYSDTPTGTTAAGVTTINLSGLASSTTYYIWVRSNCSGYFSGWSVPTTFTTLVGSTPLILDATTNGTTKTACDYSFFDSGGSAGTYQNNESYTVTVIPAVAGTKAKVVFSTFATENNYDGLSIYNGNSTGAPLINSGLPVGFNGTTCPAGSYYGTTSPGTIISSAADGSLTFKYTTDFSVVAAGWSAFISCVVTPTITSFTPADNNCGAGGTVVLTGTNFISITGVSFNGVAATYVVNSTTQITATIPASAVSGPISVSNSTATGYSSTSFFVLAAPPVTTGTVICTGGSGTISTSTVCNGFVNSGTSIAGTLTAGTDPTAPRPSPPGGNSSTCSFAAAVRNYQAIQFQVSVTGSYTFQMASPYDAMGYITTGTFTPGSCATGTYIVGDDDSNGGLQPRMSATLTAGVTYTLYTTTWSTANGTASGAYTWTITPASGGQIMLQGSPNMNWYTAATGGSAIGSGTPFNPVGVAGSGLANTNTPGTFTYYAACSSNSTCRTATTFVINARPTVTFTAQPGAAACTFNDVTYTTQAGQTNYTWVVPGVLGTDYTITSGGVGTTNNTVTLQWLTTGIKTVTINYSNALSCPAATATSSTATTVAASGLSTTVTPNTVTICANVAQVLTATSPSANFFTWTTTAGALFTDAACTVPYVPLTNFATVYYKGPANANVTVLGTVGGAGCSAPATAVITINKAIWNGSVWSNAGVGPSNTMSAEFQGNFTSSVNAAATTGDLSACSVIVTSGTVLYNRGTLTVQNTVVVNGGSLEFNDSTYDVALYQPNNVSNAAGVYNGGNIGNINFQRTSAQSFRYDYTYWSSPVYSRFLYDLSPTSPYFLEYNNAWQYITVANAMTTAMLPAKGYAVRSPISFPLAPGTAQAYQAPFIGVPNNGDISRPILGGANEMNLLGNPYPSALFADDFITANPSLNGALYFWTHASQSTSPYQYANTDYAIWTLAGGVGTTAQTSAAGSSNNSVPNGYIASGQGFFVKGLANGTAVYTNSMRRAGNNKNFYRTTSDAGLEKNRYWLNILSAEGAFKQALVGYIETATQGVDRLFDGEVVEAGNAISLYTKVDDTKLSIQGRALPFEISDTIPLSYKVNVATTCTITIPETDGLFTSQHVYLEDKVLNIIHDLTLGGYTFATEMGTFEERFVLRYTDSALAISNPVFDESSVVVYRNDQGLVINAGKETIKTVTIFDVTGRLIATQNQVGATSTVFTTLPLTQQVLLVKIEGESGRTVTKKVVY
jgi:hypothetical protein